jgi:hypothetical protein
MYKAACELSNNNQNDSEVTTSKQSTPERGGTGYSQNRLRLV